MTPREHIKDCFSCASGLGPYVGKPDGKWQVICSSCGARGPYETVERTAERAWNIICETSS